MKKLAKNSAIILCMAFMATAIQLCSTGCSKKQQSEEIYCTDPESANYYQSLPCRYLSESEKLTRVKWSVKNVRTEYYQSGTMTTQTDSAVNNWSIQFFDSGNFFEWVNGQIYQGQWQLTGSQLTMDQWTYDVDYIKMKTMKYRFKESWMLNSTLYARHTIISVYAID